SNAQNPSVTFASAGTYTVSLVASNATSSDTETKTSYINVSSSVNWYRDNDGDGFGNPAVSVSNCVQPAEANVTDGF
ncbi:MAG: PKD domain-containing protein, partial [Flavobacteriales bacterium]